MWSKIFGQAYNLVGGIIMNNSVDKLITSNHEFKVTDRNQIYMTGIKKINSFDNEEFLMESNMGIILLKGKELEMVKLDTHDGNVSIKGVINNITYVDDKTNGKEESFLAKLFK